MSETEKVVFAQLLGAATALVILQPNKAQLQEVLVQWGAYAIGELNDRHWLEDKLLTLTSTLQQDSDPRAKALAEQMVEVLQGKVREGGHRQD
jgi:hypothetical protein